MFEKILCAICWIVWIATVVSWLDISKENKMLRDALNEPVNCEAVCEQVFEHMGC